MPTTKRMEILGELEDEKGGLMGKMQDIEKAKNNMMTAKTLN